ncbi:MAG: hypothetical protein JO287_15510 [Pseudonocardiales bacterium]|nr:hypothetical protein [Pseudonocardiales bacterium]
MKWYLVVAAAVAAVGAALTVSLWHDISDRVASWLRDHGLEKNSLMDAWVLLDNQISGIRAKLRLVTRQHGSHEVVLERTYRLDQIDDPEVRAQLANRSIAQFNVLDLINE